MFCKGDLECQTKEAFFNGLKSEYQAMVVHKRDDPTISITDLLSTVRECEENQENNRHNHRADYAKAYPPSHSRPAYQDDWNARAVPPQAPPPPQSTNRYRSDNRHVDRNVPVHAACRTMKVTVTELYYIRAVPATKASLLRQTKTPLYTQANKPHLHQRPKTLCYSLPHDMVAART